MVVFQTYSGESKRRGIAFTIHTSEILDLQDRATRSGLDVYHLLNGMCTCADYAATYVGIAIRKFSGCAAVSDMDSLIASSGPSKGFSEAAY